MATLPVSLALGGLSFLGGALANKPKTYKTTQQQDSSSDQSGNSSQTPVWDPATNQLRMQLLQAYGSNLNDDPDLSGYQAQGLSQINQAADVRTSAIKNSLAARGLSYSPQAAFAPAMSDSARIGDAASFVNSVPLLRQQMMQQKLSQAGGFLKGLPIGSQTDNWSTQHGSSTSSGTSTDPGNMSGGGFSSLATTLAGLFGKNNFGFGK